MTSTETIVWGRCPYCRASAGEPCRTSRPNRDGTIRLAAKAHNGRSATLIQSASR